jgi:ubiquitin-conjugating enzyme E2 variant
MLTFLFIVLQALGVVMLADFVSGLVHWAEDAYGTEETPVVGPLLIRANIVHHHHPRYFTRLSWWKSSRDSAIANAVILMIGAWVGILGWQLWLFAFVSTNANQVHKWAHRTRAENGRVITFFQDIGLLLTPRNHAVHHSDPKNTYYCPATNLVNPLLEWMRFWNAVEWVIWRITGVKHRQDTSIRGQGPGPAWLKSYRATPAAVSPRPLTAAGVRTRLHGGCARCVANGKSAARSACARLSHAGRGEGRRDEVMGSFPQTIQS